MIGDLTSAPEPIEIKLFSPNPDLLREWAPRVADQVKKISGVVDVLNGIDRPADIVIANPPYLVDAARRVYRHGGGEYGSALSVRIGRKNEHASKDEEHWSETCHALP